MTCNLDYDRDLEVEDYTLPEYIAMYIIRKSPASKSHIIKQAIKDFGNIIEHGPYLYGEYSDDIDEAVGTLLNDGLAYYIDDHRIRIGLTDYGREYLRGFILCWGYEDEDWEKVRERVDKDWEEIFRRVDE